MKNVLGGWSGLTKSILRHLFLIDKVATDGMVLPVAAGGSDLTVRCAVHAL